MKIHHLGFLCLVTGSLFGQVTYDPILHADREPQNWLTYSGTYKSQRYSLLNEITPENVKDLQLQWLLQTNTSGRLEATPIVVDGILYYSAVQGEAQKQHTVYAVDALTGRVFWTYTRQVSPKTHGTMVNRGVAIAGHTLYLATLDAHLVALDTKDGTVDWDVKMADTADGYQANEAPLVVKDKVIIGITTNEYGSNCWIAAYDVHTGKEAWRFHTVPGAGEPGHDTWGPGNAWEHGGAPVWLTGSYDPDLNLVYWGTGNPNPSWNGDHRPGDNLYSNCVVALDAGTGKLKWYYQFTPHDEFDWDSTQIPVLVDSDWQGKSRKLMLWANRNGMYYVLDRETGEFLLGKAFVKQNWNAGFDARGKPIRTPNSKSRAEGVFIQPENQGGTNWYSPSYSPRTGLFYVSAWENHWTLFAKTDEEYEKGKQYTGGMMGGPLVPGWYDNTPLWQGRRPINPPYRTEQEGYSAVRALDAKTGERKWEFKMIYDTECGILTTASDLLFSGGMEGYFFALDAKTGQPLWNINLGAAIDMGPIAYAVDGHEYIAVGASSGLFIFAVKR